MNYFKNFHLLFFIVIDVGNLVWTGHGPHVNDHQIWYTLLLKVLYFIKSIYLMINVERSHIHRLKNSTNVHDRVKALATQPITNYRGNYCPKANYGNSRDLSTTFCHKQDMNKTFCPLV